MLAATDADIILAKAIAAATKDALSKGVTAPTSAIAPVIDPSVFSGMDPVLEANADGAQEIVALALLKTLQANLWEPWRTVGQSGQPAFNAGFSAAGLCRFRKSIFGEVEIQCDLTVPIAMGAAFQLPAGYRPGDLDYVITGQCDLPGPCDVQISGTGNVTVQNDSFTGGATEVWINFRFFANA
jgi:hypothetical protein